MAMATVGSAHAARPLDAVIAETPSKVDGGVPAVVVAIDDVRASSAWADRRWARWAGIKIVDRFFGPNAPADAGMGIFGDLKAIASVMSKEGPVPVNLVAGLSAGRPFVVASLKASAGVLDRIVQSQPMKPWTFTKDGDTIVAKTETGVWIGKMDGGWLRFWLNAVGTVEAKGLELPDSLQESMNEAQSIMHYDGSTPAGDLLRALTANSEYGIWAEIRGLSVLSGFRGDRTTWSTLVVDHPRLPMFSPLLTLGRANGKAAQLWGPQATTNVNLSIPAGLLQAGALAMSNMPDSLRELVQDLDGRFSVGVFGASTDWGLAIGVTSAAAAKAAVPKLKAGLTQLAQRGNTAWKKFFFDVTPGRFSLRPDPNLSGYDVLASGDRLVILSQPNRKLRPEKAVSLMTPGVKKLLDSDKMFSTYTVIGDDGTYYEFLRWGLAMALVDWGDSIPAFVQQIVERYADKAAAMMTVAQASLLFIYDIGLAVDLKGNLLIIDVVGSEL